MPQRTEQWGATRGVQTHKSKPIEPSIERWPIKHSQIIDGYPPVPVIIGTKSRRFPEAIGKVDTRVR
jgi:hypothetical protein